MAPDNKRTKALKQSRHILKPLIITRRFHFHRRDQAPGSRISARTWRLASKCNFGAYLDQALRDRLVESAKGVEKPCYRCRKASHAQQNCGFQEATCHSCGTKGHISRVCKSSRGHNRYSRRSKWVDTHRQQPQQTGEDRGPLSCRAETLTSISSHTGTRRKGHNHGDRHRGIRIPDL